MRKFERAGEPAICIEHSASWNAQWVSLRNANPKATFNWYTINGRSAREHLLPALQAQSDGHCSFCDAFPVAGVSSESVEHFRPKSKFPERAYTWTNLYYCCDACQKAKREEWDEALLHADAQDYSFSRYFEFDFTTGGIKPNSLASEADQQRAAITVKIYGLDSPARRRNRLREAEVYAKCQTGEISQQLWAYRDYLGLSHYWSGESPCGLRLAGVGYRPKRTHQFRQRSTSITRGRIWPADSTRNDQLAVSFLLRASRRWSGLKIGGCLLLSIGSVR
jgi:uncharacterized protein (TIGR02646 family)